MPPDSKGLADDFSDSVVRNPKSQSPAKVSTPRLGPISMREVCSCQESDRPLIETIVGMENKGEGCGDGCVLSLESLTLIRRI